jgi:hypothetical protein
MVVEELRLCLARTTNKLERARQRVRIASGGEHLFRIRVARHPRPGSKILPIAFVNLQSTGELRPDLAVLHYTTCKWILRACT